jgi:putative SOS response-associated peptidase YedK
MCGRFATPSGAAMQKVWRIEDVDWDAWVEHYNVAPTQTVPMVVQSRDRALRLLPARWGLIPSWWKQPAPPSLTFNARSEEAAEKPTWRGSLRSMRCLMPAMGWYEWNEHEQTRSTSGRKVNQPYYILSTDDPVIAIAGLWSIWNSPLGVEVVSCALMTKEAAPSNQAIHHRMPLIPAPDHFDAWLSPETSLDEVRSLIQGSRGDFIGHRVSTRVNTARYDDAELLVEVTSSSLF